MADLNTLQILQNVKQLLTVGLFPGSHGQYVAAAIDFMDSMIRENTPNPPPPGAMAPVPTVTAEDFDAAGVETLGPKGKQKVSVLSKKRR